MKMIMFGNMQVVDVPEEEREKYNNYDRRLDIEN